MVIETIEVPDHGARAVEGSIGWPAVRMRLDLETGSALQLRRRFEQPFENADCVRVVVSTRSLALRAADQHDLARRVRGNRHAACTERNAERTEHQGTS